MNNIHNYIHVILRFLTFKINSIISYTDFDYWVKIFYSFLIQNKEKYAKKSIKSVRSLRPNVLRSLINASPPIASIPADTPNLEAQHLYVQKRKAKIQQVYMLMPLIRKYSRYTCKK